jgi:hypothetical protein
MFYPYDRGRYRPESGIPVICHSTLSPLSDDPDGLLDLPAAELPGWPRHSAAGQYRALFAFLAGRPRCPASFPDPGAFDISRSGPTVLCFGGACTTASARRWPGWRRRYS